MCLISVCPNGTKKNTEEVYKFIRSGADCNSDGSGFMYKKNGEGVVHVDKGYFKIEAMIDKLKSLNLADEDELVIHHRTGTSGLTSPENTHPFVLTDNEDEIEKTNISIDKPAMVHNGMFQYLYTYMNKNPNFSDTYAFARYILGNKHLLNIYKEDPEFFLFIFKGCIGTDKICIVFPEKDRELEMIGTYIETNGYFHSNSGYCRTVYDRGGKSWEKHWGQRNSISNTLPEKEDEEIDEETPKDLGLNCAVKPLISFEDANKFLNKVLESNSTNHLLLDSSYITLTGENGHHFAFVNKKTYDHCLPSQKSSLVLKVLGGNGFDPDCLNHILSFRLSGTKYTTPIDEAVRTKDLIKDFYYIPRGTYYGSIYRDFKNLVDLRVIPTVEVMNGVQKILQAPTSIKKKPEDKIFYAKHADMYSKMSLEMLLERYRKEYIATAKKEHEKKNHALFPLTELFSRS